MHKLMTATTTHAAFRNIPILSLQELSHVSPASFSVKHAKFSWSEIQKKKERKKKKYTNIYMEIAKQEKKL